MNENIDLTKILKDCPEGWEFWSDNYGKVRFKCIIKSYTNSINYPIFVRRADGIPAYYTKEGWCNSDFPASCLLWPSKDQRDWSKFTTPWLKKKSEHKFHLGQYITDGYMSGQITSIENHYYCYKILDFIGGINTIIPFALQDNYHLWTINDAKDGDVLALSWLEDENLWEKIIIFKKYHSEGVKGIYNRPCVEGYGNTFKNGKIACIDEKVPYYSKTWTCNLYPATKEQCDLLFQKIKETGYKWNVETKTLEKLVKPKFDPKTLQPFDKVLVRSNKNCIWDIDFYSHKYKGTDIVNKAYPYKCVGNSQRYCIPYNDETKHLIDTNEEAPEYYRYWED